jgi:Arc/MetJ family transcription regulator
LAVQKALRMAGLKGKRRAGYSALLMAVQLGLRREQTKAGCWVEGKAAKLDVLTERQ